LYSAGRSALSHEFDDEALPQLWGHGRWRPCHWVINVFIAPRPGVLLRRGLRGGEVSSEGAGVALPPPPPQEKISLPLPFATEGNAVNCRGRVGWGSVRHCSVLSPVPDAVRHVCSHRQSGPFRLLSIPNGLREGAFHLTPCPLSAAKLTSPRRSVAERGCRNSRRRGAEGPPASLKTPPLPRLDAIAPRIQHAGGGVRGGGS
jgi:hypothetical protein